MADQIPVYAHKDSNGVNALGEYNTGDSIPVIHGGTGKVSIAANKFLYSTAANVYSEGDITSAALNLLNKTSTSTMRSYLGLVIGTNSGQVITASADGMLPAMDARNLKNTLPAGIIMMWSGTISSIPSNFKLCDGKNGTPDLRDKFIVGAGSSYTPRNTGGETTHTHTVTVQNTTLTVDQMPSHSHYAAYTNLTPSGVDYGGAPNEPLQPWNYNNTTNHFLTSSQGGDQPHTHETTVATASNLPPYYALAYIMSVII